MAANSLNDGRTPDPLFTFEAIGDLNLYTPPDTNGDVGPNHYVQIVNVKIAVYDKSGGLLYGPVDINTLWDGYGGPCELYNDGDPIVLYDDMADRWMISQFAVEVDTRIPVCRCFDHSGPIGQLLSVWFLHARFSGLSEIWRLAGWLLLWHQHRFPNQYYAHALDRVSMLAGLPAARISFGGLCKLVDACGCRWPARRLRLALPNTSIPTMMKVIRIIHRG